MGVALLPFIDRERLVKAMKKADKNGKALTVHEREDLNKRGDVMVFFEEHEHTRSALIQTLAQVKGKPVQLFASFKREDHLSGSIRTNQQGLQMMYQEIKQEIEGKLNLERVTKNKVHRLVFEQTQYERHITRLLEKVKEPERQVEDFEIHQINRRFFNGERVIKMLEEVLGFDTGVSQVQ